MLYVRQYNKKALDRSSISTVDYYKKLINKLNMDTFNLSDEFSSLLDTIRDMRKRLNEQKDEVQNDLSTIRADTHNAGINADNTLDQIQGIIDQCEKELEDLETEVEVECNQCDYCDYCDFTTPEPICVYDDDCNNVDCYEDLPEGTDVESCTWTTTGCTYDGAPGDDCTFTAAGSCYYSDQGNCTFDATSCIYTDTCGNCTFTTEDYCRHNGVVESGTGGGCGLNGAPDADCRHEGTCNWQSETGHCEYSGVCVFNGQCEYNGDCNFTNGDSSCFYTGDCEFSSVGDFGCDNTCAFIGFCTFNNPTGGECSYRQPDPEGPCYQDCTFEWDDSCSECNYTCSYDDDGLSCAYSEECSQDLVCGETSCGECNYTNDCGNYYDCSDSDSCYDCSNDN